MTRSVTRRIARLSALLVVLVGVVVLVVWAWQRQLVYFPDAKEILGRPVFRTVASIGRPVDMVNVFRRPHDINQHIDDILAAKPKSVWFQLGIRNDEAARRFAEAGIKVVQDRCLMVEHARLMR